MWLMLCYTFSGVLCSLYDNLTIHRIYLTPFLMPVVSALYLHLESSSGNRMSVYGKHESLEYMDISTCGKVVGFPYRLYPSHVFIASPTIALIYSS